MTTGIEPGISMTENKIRETERISLGSMFLRSQRSDRSYGTVRSQTCDVDRDSNQTFKIVG